MMIQTAASVFRKYDADGVPASGPHQPDKGEIVALLTALQTLSNNCQAGPFDRPRSSLKNKARRFTPGGPLSFQGRRRHRASVSRLLNGTGFGSGIMPVPLQGSQIGNGSIGSPTMAGRMSIR